MKRFYILLISVLSIASLNSCKKFLDVVPDNVATIENAFTMRTQALKYLFTCYSYMPRDADPNLNPALTGGDEFWRPENFADENFNIARGFQNKVSPFPYNSYYWNNSTNDLFKAIRACNIMLENIDQVPDMTPFEKRQWASEVKVLKAYYHFYLLRLYGPIPVIKQNLPIDADINQVRVSREPIDNCVGYIVQLLDEALADLPAKLTNAGELGRITQPVALSLKAKVLITAASPLYNGNTDQAGLRNADGTVLFNQQFSKAKWDLAVEACKAAITACETQGIELFTYKGNIASSPEIKTQLNIRNAITEAWNSEVIWANTQSISNTVQALSQAHLDPVGISNTAVRDNLSPTLKIAEQFYSKNGVPINEDKTYNYGGRYSLRTGTAAERLYMQVNYESVALNFDREPRYYADLGFDGGVWYGQGRYNENADLWILQGKNGQLNGKAGDIFGSVTGFWPKKLVHFQNTIDNSYVATMYPWPIIRLADLYLLYAEALNESQGPNAEAYKYIDLVRSRAGLQSVESSWTNFSTNPSKFTSQAGLRNIIQQERLIELCFEGQRFWDLRRWKTAAAVVSGPVKGWNLRQKSAADYYKPITLFTQTFGSKDYFLPIKDNDISVNPKLVQNLGW